MAIVTTRVYCPDPGVIWQQAVSQWQVYMNSASDTFTYTVEDLSGYRAVVTNRVGSVNTNRTELLDVSQTAASRYRPDVLCSFPGWNTTPQANPTTSNGRDTRSKWGTELMALRKLILGGFTNADVGPVNYKDEAQPFLTVNTAVAFMAYAQKCIMGVDISTLTTYTTVASQNLVGNSNIAQGNKTPNIPVVSSGGGGGITDEQVDRIVASIDALALNQLEVDLNHGNVVVRAIGGSVLAP